MNVLLVDDELPALRRLQETVKAELPKAQLHSFSKAREAMDFAAQTPVDLAFLDINMRFLDGITMAKTLTEQYPLCNIIFCTGYEEYALDAMKVYCSDYVLKPISTEKMHTALAHLRHPLPQNKKRLELRCFGNFDVRCDGNLVPFKYRKTRELLAYLTDRAGAEATTREIMAAIFEEDKLSYFSKLRLDLLDTFTALGIQDTIYTAYGKMRVVREQVDCDYYDYLDGKNTEFRGEYMSQYSFAEKTCAFLNKKFF